MKTKLLLLLLLMLHLTATAQTAPAIQWQAAIGGTGQEWGQDILQLADGSFITSGTSSSNNGQVSGGHGYFDIWVTKLTPYGSVVWQKCYGGSNMEYGFDLKQTVDGGYIIVGSTRSNDGQITINAGQDDFWIVKINAVGNLEWQKTFGGSNNERAATVTLAADGGYFIGGYTESNNGHVTNNHGYADGWLVKLNASGLLQWRKTYGGPGGDGIFSTTATADGGLICVGFNTSNGGDVSGNHGGFDAWILKLNGTGTIEWQKSMGGSGNEQFNSVQQTPDGGYIMAGKTTSANGDVTLNNGLEDYWIVRLNPQGLVTWQKTYGGAGNDEAWSISRTVEGGYIVVGSSASTTNILGGVGTTDAWALKMDVNGNLQWQKAMGGSEGDQGLSIKQTADNGYIMAGSSRSSDGNVSFNQGLQDAWIVKLAPDNLGIPAHQKASLLLYPNPTATFFEVSLPQNSSIDAVVISDLSGKTVLQVAAAASNKIDVSGLESGMYLVQVLSEGNRYVEKLWVP